MEFVVDHGRGANPTWRLSSGIDMVAWAGTTFDDTARATRAAEALRGWRCHGPVRGLSNEQQRGAVACGAQ